MAFRDISYNGYHSLLFISHVMRPFFPGVYTYTVHEMTKFLFPNKPLRERDKKPSCRYRIADRTASQHLLGHMPFPIGGPLAPSLYL